MKIKSTMEFGMSLQSDQTETVMVEYFKTAVYMIKKMRLITVR